MSQTVDLRVSLSLFRQPRQSAGMDTRHRRDPCRQFPPTSFYARPSHALRKETRFSRFTGNSVRWE